MSVTAAKRSDVTPDVTKVSNHLCCSLNEEENIKKINGNERGQKEVKRERERERERGKNSKREISV